jgi:hypothetical protein
MACTLALATAMIAIRYRIETLADGPVPAVAENSTALTTGQPEPVK